MNTIRLSPTNMTTWSLDHRRRDVDARDLLDLVRERGVERGAEGCRDFERGLAGDGREDVVERLPRRAGGKAHGDDRRDADHDRQQREDRAAGSLAEFADAEAECRPW